MDKLREVMACLTRRKLTLCTAESLTGGMLGELVTGVSGSSAVYRGGAITYCNKMKQKVLGVDWDDLSTLGAVSEPVARQMACGVRTLFQADFALSTTGIAGPSSDETGKPVGLVYIGLAWQDGVRVEEHRFTGSREEIRTQTCEAAFALLLEQLSRK